MTAKEMPRFIAVSKSLSIKGAYNYVPIMDEDKLIKIIASTNENQDLRIYELRKIGLRLEWDRMA